MNKIITVLCGILMTANAFAVINLTPTAVKVTDLTVDKNNYFIVVNATANQSEYEVAFDLYPATKSVIGNFSAAANTIAYVNSYVCKLRYQGKTLNTMYYCEQSSDITLTVTRKDESTCTLSGSIDAFSQNGDKYTYVIPAFDFPYTAEDTSDDDTQNPYRFEPVKDTTIYFYADVVSIRLRDNGKVNITLNAIADETYHWIDLNLLSDVLALPAGTYSIDSTGNPGTLTASRGYIGLQNDDPCYLALRHEEMWGAYTPYYLTSGTLTVSYNQKTDTLFIVGECHSKNGSTVHISAKSYNTLYVPDTEPSQKESVELTMDTVAITYLREQADTVNHRYPYTFSFSGKEDGFPQVLTNVVLSKPMELVQGTYTLHAGQLSGVVLFQDQEDYNTWFFGGTPYVFDSVELILSTQDNVRWTYSMLITDTIGSHYSFTLQQQPHIINYPLPDEDKNDKPYTDESRQTETLTVAFDSIVWNTTSVAKDGIVDIMLLQRKSNAQGLSYVAQLGLFANTKEVPAGQYPVNDTENNFTFSASMGRYGNVLIPCYVAIADRKGGVYKVWYVVDGTITISYTADGHPVLQGECTSYFGSAIRFSYQPPTTGVHDVSETPAAIKFLRNGQILIRKGNTTYTVTGVQVK